MKTAHSAYTSDPPSYIPSFDNIFSIPVNDLEAQQHIIEYQLPIAVKQYNVGLVVMDSVAANYRAEYETGTAEGLAERAKDLAKLGKMFRTIAIKHNLAVVVTNQVSDRFDEPFRKMSQDHLQSLSPALSSPPAPLVGKPARKPARTSDAMTSAGRRDEIMSLDHQQRFFTGWGEDRSNRFEDMKTPALGFAWTNQIAARVVLKVENERVSQRPEDYLRGNIWRDRRRRRFLSVVFAPWVEPTEVPVEYEIKRSGITSITDRAQEEQEKVGAQDSFSELLDEKLWGFDSAEEDEEFP
jgi:DNA repair protein RAD57